MDSSGRMWSVTEMASRRAAQAPVDADCQPFICERELWWAAESVLLGPWTWAWLSVGQISGDSGQCACAVVRPCRLVSWLRVASWICLCMF